LESVDVPALAEPNVAVVRDVQWQVREGEHWLVAGPPGSGKSSALSVAAGLARPLRGRYRLFGAELNSLHEADRVALRARVGIVFGNGGRLFAHWTLLENLLLPLNYHGRIVGRETERRLEELLDQLRLKPYARWYPRQVSRAIAQRAALARAMVLDPEVLLLDDPLDGLPPSEVTWWLEVLQQTLQAGRLHTLIVTSTETEAWRDLTRHYAWVEDRRWHVLPDRDTLHQHLHQAGRS
jgi:ABC-type transporter Mla maintaining outer membrane lipid asymmetry ATPase subunit MlaF